MEVYLDKNEQKLLPPTDWAEEIQGLKDELLQERDRHLRTLADFKNYRVRIEREGNRIVEEGKRAMMLPLLDIVDDIEKALIHANNKDKQFMNGIQIIHRKFLVLLEKYGVMAFESTGMPFNHNLHEAVAMVRNKGVTPGTVVDELRRGYLLNNELLRAAQVRVAE
jgi:molecular chaperone GrpE